MGRPPRGHAAAAAAAYDSEVNVVMSEELVVEIWIRVYNTTIGMYGGPFCRRTPAPD